MNPDVGEYIVGAYLKSVKQCDFVDYNVRIPGGGLKGLSELDVIGLDLKTNTAYLCEVTTHISGLLYTNNQKEYAEKMLGNFSKKIFMFWSPYVPEGYITKHLREIETLELVLNKDYTACVEEMRQVAKQHTNDLGNPFLRVLQILEHLR